MTAVAILDDHAAVRTGLEEILRLEPDLTLVGASASERELWQLLRRSQPDVVVLDLHHPGRDGLVLSLRIKREPDAPRVILYSASADSELIVPATLAGADAIVDKSSPSDELVRTIRSVASGQHRLGTITPWMQARAASRLDPALRPVLAMRLAGTPPDEIGATLGLGPAKVARWTAAMVARLTSVAF
jgi:DNA-binding NarL/FixJ family response regulator